MFIYFLIAVGVVWLLLIHSSLVCNYANQKGYEGIKVRLMGLVPVFSFIYYYKKPTIKDITVKVKLITSFYPRQLIATILTYTIIVILAVIVVVPISVIFYVSISNHFLSTLLITYFGIVLVLLHQGLVVDYAAKRGYEGIKPGIIGLIPVFGFVYYSRKKPLRQLPKGVLKRTFSPRNVLSRFLIYAEITLLVVIVLIPVVYMIGLSLDPRYQSEIPKTIWPTAPSLNSYRYLFQETHFAIWYKNTFIIALINMIFGTLIVTGAAYVYARYSFKGKKSSLLGLLVLQSFPTFLGLLAMYVLFETFGLLNKPNALSILYIGGAIPGNLWLIKGFLSQIPKDLDESAEIDGANKLQIFFRIILPLSVPIITFVAVSLFMAPWMDYMLPGYLLGNPPPSIEEPTKLWTLAIGLFRMVSDNYYMNYSAFAAGAIIVGLPITVLYVAFQKFLIEGITAGATKG